MIDMPLHETIELLQNARLGRLAMVTAENRPYAIPLRFLWHENAVYMRIAYDGRKHEALAFSNHVCLEADTSATDLSNYASVIIEGTVVDVADPVEKEEALFRYHQKYARVCRHGVPPRPVTINGVALRKLIVEKVSGRKREPDDLVTQLPKAVPTRLFRLAPAKRPAGHRSKR